MSAPKICEKCGGRVECNVCTVAKTKFVCVLCTAVYSSKDGVFLYYERDFAPVEKPAPCFDIPDCESVDGQFSLDVAKTTLSVFARQAATQAAGI